MHATDRPTHIHACTLTDWLVLVFIQGRRERSWPTHAPGFGFFDGWRYSLSFVPAPPTAPETTSPPQRSPPARRRPHKSPTCPSNRQNADYSLRKMAECHLIEACLFDSDVPCTYIVCMIKFEWDPRKDAANQKKHCVSFAEAQSVFFDENAVQFYDEAHSGQEERFIMLGLSLYSRLLVVCHCERKSGNVIRIISARKATASERTYYVG